MPNSSEAVVPGRGSADRILPQRLQVTGIIRLAGVLELADGHPGVDPCKVVGAFGRHRVAQALQRRERRGPLTPARHAQVRQCALRCLPVGRVIHLRHPANDALPNDALLLMLCP